MLRQVQKGWESLKLKIIHYPILLMTILVLVGCSSDDDTPTFPTSPVDPATTQSPASTPTPTPDPDPTPTPNPSPEPNPVPEPNPATEPNPIPDPEPEPQPEPEPEPNPTPMEHTCIQNAVGCDASAPFACDGSQFCYASMEVCANSQECMVGGVPDSQCAVSEDVCPSDQLYTCGTALFCYSTEEECRSSTECGGANAPLLMNPSPSPEANSCTTNIAGCPRADHFSCAAAENCFTTLDECKSSNQCP